MKNWINSSGERGRLARIRRRLADGTLRARPFLRIRSCVSLLIEACILAILANPNAAHACSACFGQSDSAMAKGMNAGIFALLAIIGGVLAGAASFFVFLARRSSAMEKEQKTPSAETKSE
jgi:hypothetical protein